MAPASLPARPISLALRGRLEHQRATRRLTGEGSPVPGVLVRVATGSDHVPLEREGVARADDDGRQHADLVFEEMVQIGEDLLLKLAVRALHEGYGGRAGPVTGDDVVRFHDLARPATARRIVE